MEISYLLARILGITLIVLFSAVLINQDFYKGMWHDVTKHPISLVLSGIILLICGLIIINVHNIWHANWQGLITLIGWLFTLAGISRIVIPNVILRFARRMENNITFNLLSVIMLLIGIYLTYMGFRF
jgi:uncharacterized membrane protein HdeD (DUF308 family)